MAIEIILAFLFGVTFLGVLTYAALRPEPISDEHQFFLLRVVAAISAAACAAIVPGFLDVNIGLTAQIVVRAGGAIAVFVVIYLLNPPRIALSPAAQDIQQNELPTSEIIDQQTTPIQPNQPQVGFVFANSQDYPQCTFSIVNHSRSPIQITGLQVINVATIKVEAGPTRHLMGARMRIDVDLCKMDEGNYNSVLQGQVSNLGPGEAEAFAINFTSENSINLIDLEAEYIAANMTEPGIIRPAKLLFISAPVETENWTGTIQLIARNQCFEAICKNELPPLAGPIAEKYSNDVLLLLYRGMAHICWGRLEERWEQIEKQFLNTICFGPIAASFAEFSKYHKLPPTITIALETWLSDPKQLSKAPVWDNESHALIVQEALLDSVSTSKSEDRLNVPQHIVKILAMLDSNVSINKMFEQDRPDRESDINDNIEDLLGEVTVLENRKSLLRKLIDQYSVGCIEYLIVNLRMASLNTSAYEELLYECLGMEDFKFCSEESVIQQRWTEWWEEHDNKKEYRTLEWRPHSPRLGKASKALEASNSNILKEMAKSKDPIVRLAVARNPFINLEVVKELVRWPEIFIRLSLAENPDTSRVILNLLANDESSFVRRWVACNPNTDSESIAILEKDKSSAVREFLKKRKQTTSST